MDQKHQTLYCVTVGIFWHSLIFITSGGACVLPSVEVVVWGGWGVALAPPSCCTPVSLVCCLVPSLGSGLVCFPSALGFVGLDQAWRSTATWNLSRHTWTSCDSARSTGFGHWLMLSKCLRSASLLYMWLVSFLDSGADRRVVWNTTAQTNAYSFKYTQTPHTSSPYTHYTNHQSLFVFSFCASLSGILILSDRIKVTGVKFVRSLSKIGGEGTSNDFPKMWNENCNDKRHQSDFRWTIQANFWWSQQAVHNLCLIYTIYYIIFILIYVGMNRRMCVKMTRFCKFLCYCWIYENHFVRLWYKKC